MDDKEMKETVVETPENNEKVKLFDKKKYFILLGLIVLMIIATISVTTYAYFSIANQVGNENVITSGSMRLKLTDGPQITAENMIPGDTVTKTFTVENTGDIDAKYDIYLSELVNTFADQTDLVYQIVSNDGGYNTTLDQQVPAVSSKIINQYDISPGEVHSYTLIIKFLSKNENQNDNQGKEFKAKVSINEVNSATIPASNVALDSANTTRRNVQDALDELNDLLG